MDYDDHDDEDNNMMTTTLQAMQLVWEKGKALTARTKDEQPLVLDPDHFCYGGDGDEVDGEDDDENYDEKATIGARSGQ